MFQAFDEFFNSPSSSTLISKHLHCFCHKSFMYAHCIHVNLSVFFRSLYVQDTNHIVNSSMKSSSSRIAWLPSKTFVTVVNPKIPFVFGFYRTKNSIYRLPATLFKIESKLKMGTRKRRKTSRRLHKPI